MALIKGWRKIEDPEHLGYEEMWVHNTATVSIKAVDMGYEVTVNAKNYYDSLVVSRKQVAMDKARAFMKRY